MVDQLRAHGIERVELWPGGVDTARFQPAPRNESMRQRLMGEPTGSEKDKPLLLYVGRLSAEKNLERLKPILQALPGARLALVGDGPHRKALAQFFEGLPVSMPGFLRGDDLAAAYASADVFVMPSRTETLGLVILEAMSSGLPVVAARAGGIPELIDDGVSGCLFDEEQQAVEAIRQFLDSAEKRARFGAAAREHAIAQSWGNATRVLLEHYRAACATQTIAVDRPTSLQVRGFRLKARKIAGRSTMAVLRRLLP
jgi:glycosyltransferase involved in cell wall biosynthesis